MLQETKKMSGGKYETTIENYKTTIFCYDSTI